MTTVEPEWDQATRDLVLALDAIPRCSVCGRPSAICQDVERQLDWQVDPPKRCHPSTAVAEQRERFTEETNPHVQSLVFPVHLRDPRTGDA